MSARLVPAVRDLFGEHPQACRLSAEQVAGLLWILRFVADEDGGREKYLDALRGYVRAGRSAALELRRGAA